MMTVPDERAERLAEIFREIFALSETNRRNHSESAAVADSIKLFDAPGTNGTPETPRGKQATDQRSQAEDQESRS